LEKILKIDGKMISLAIWHQFRNGKNKKVLSNLINQELFFKPTLFVEILRKSEASIIE